MQDQQSLAVYAVLMRHVLVVGARKSRQVPSVSPDRKLPPPLANITLPTTHSAIRSIPDAPLARPPVLLASKRTVIVRPSHLVVIPSALSVSFTKAWHCSSATFLVLT